MKTRARVLVTMSCAMVCAAAAAQDQPAATRGQLLYTTHCIACHTSQVHWRNSRRATDWESLKQQVRQWQASSQLSWSEADVTEVARYLNETIYKFAQTSDRKS